MMSIQLKFNSLKLWAAFFLAVFAVGCDDSDGGHLNVTDGGDSSDSTSSDVPVIHPKVLSTIPMGNAVEIPLNGLIHVTFSEAMDPTTLNTSTFTLTAGDPPVGVEGTIIYKDSTAVFWPSAHLTGDTVYVGTLTQQARSAAGIPLESEYSWNFTTSQFIAPGLPVALGTAVNFAILAKSAISNVPTSAITGDVGISPAAATFVTGFSLTADATNVFSTAPQIIGSVYAADFAPPTPENMTTTISDMELAFTDAAGRAPDVTELAAGNIGGLILPAGVYQWGTGVSMMSDITISGSATDVWIFQIAQDLTVGSGARMVLTGGALPQNIFWQVAGFVDFGTTSHGEGVFMCQTAITLRTGASVNGRRRP